MLRPLDRLAAEEQVARDGELRDQRRVLVDRLDAVGDRVGRVPDVDLPALHVDFAAGRAHRARQHLDQRRLAGAVVAEQADDLVAEDAERHAVERAHASVIFADVLHEDEFFAGEFFGHGQFPDWCLRSRPECRAIMPRMIAPMKML